MTCLKLEALEVGAQVVVHRAPQLQEAPAARHRELQQPALASFRAVKSNEDITR